MTDDEFRGEASGEHYAQARYLCYYLQEQGLLRAFFRAFRRDHAQDPRGYRTLVRILGDPDMKAFQKRWERWVLNLAFPARPSPVPSKRRTS